MRKTSKPRTILLCPGPVLLSKTVRRAVGRANMGHREPDFSAVLVESTEMLRPIIGIDETYEVALITGSGTAANETVLSSLGSRGPLLVISNGEFGERLFAVATLHNPEVDHLQFAWQAPIDLSAVSEMLQARAYSMVALVHHETSTGILNPVAEITALAHRHGAIVSVDAISSIGAEEIRAREWGVDILVGASGKALSAMPGVGILVVRSALLDTLTEPSAASSYLDLYNHFYHMRNFTQTPNTPAVHVCISLHASLKEITALGVERFQETIRQRALYTRRQVTRMGLTYASYDGANSNVLTCIELPEHLSFNQLARGFKRKGIVIYNGKGALKDRTFQVGHIGALRATDTPYAVRQLRKMLRSPALVEVAGPVIGEPQPKAVHGGA
jgi:2-aminoethylphosphonate-pyruvate transaminase